MLLTSAKHRSKTFSACFEFVKQSSILRHEAFEAYTRQTGDRKQVPQLNEKNASLIFKQNQCFCGAGITCDMITPQHRIPGCSHPHSPLHDHIPESPCTSTITLHITCTHCVGETFLTKYYRI